jgi:molybdopterin/thiamine biosynthesis adenylyltransferase|tara:strand:- start:5718 stop:7265 length:1548 start_codon:yes stop_codon:yes gene_type:complete
MNDIFLRQRGLVNQNRLSELKILVSGSSGGVSDLVVLLSQLGIGQQSGCIGIVKPQHPPNSVFWKLAYPDAKLWSDWERLSPIHRKVFSSTTEVEGDNYDYHLCLNPSEQTEKVNLYGFAHGPRAMISREFLVQKTVSSGHILTPSMRVTVAATMLQQLLRDVDCMAQMKISDAWFTVTCRVESTDLEEVRSHIFGIDGTLVDVQLTSDGNATLARYRPSQQPDQNVFDFLSRTMQPSQTGLSVSEDIGLIAWHEPNHPLDSSWELVGHELVILGAGGLGSWSAPLLFEQMKEGTFHIVDGDPEIELHNLNRQVLYNEQHLGCVKASTASERLRELNPLNQVKSYFEYLNPHHLISESLTDENDDFDDLGLEPSPLGDALKSSRVYLACLDNMIARTILNEAAINNGSLMINGATEAYHGVVETFDQNGCMVCRYGRESARSTEVISCTEEGIRPIASIVTSTAWVGAMMALMAIINLHPDTNLPNFRATWYEGELEKSSPTQPPWFDEPCKYHI